MLRFRTVDASKPAYLTMNERLTRVGRFIRDCSLDDLPNLLNVLAGDLSLVGPRPTEPERVDGSDPAWQQILTVKPGMFSPAILVLGQRYNSSPFSLKQQLELAYVQQQSFRYDLHLFWQGMRGYFASKGNWKARGKPAIELKYTTYRSKMDRSAQAEPQHPVPSVWKVVDWLHPDLSYIAPFVHERARTWEPYVPQFCLVPCVGSGQKPALFLKVTHGYGQWSANVRLQDVRWPVVENNRYLCLGCTLFFEDVTDASLGLRAGEDINVPTENAHRLVCSAILDVACTEVETWFSAWQQVPGEIPLFIVSIDLANVHHRSFAIHNPSLSGSEFKAQAMRYWQEAKTRLQQSDHALENFEAEQEMLWRTLPHAKQWASAEAALRTK